MSVTIGFNADAAKSRAFEILQTRGPCVGWTRSANLPQACRVLRRHGMSGKACYLDLRDSLFCGLFIILIGFSPLRARVTEYAAPFVALSGIAAGPDGAMWSSGRKHRADHDGRRRHVVSASDFQRWGRGDHRGSRRSDVVYRRQQRFPSQDRTHHDQRGFHRVCAAQPALPRRSPRAPTGTVVYRVGHHQYRENHHFGDD